jgi:Uma2 family endonuclease
MSIQADNSLVDRILELPEAPVLLDRLRSALAEEQLKRVDFYEHVSEMEKSEFINGEVIVHSPVKKEHNEVNGNLYKIIDTYVVEHDLGFVGIEKILIKLTRNDYEPDLCFFGKEKSKLFKKGQQFFPEPDLVIEVLSKGTEKRDRGIKFEDYGKHQVEEYWIIDPRKEILEQYHLKKGKYELVHKSTSGVVKSFVLKGLEIPVEVIFDKKKTHEFVKAM